MNEFIFSALLISGVLDAVGDKLTAIGCTNADCAERTPAEHQLAQKFDDFRRFDAVLQTPLQCSAREYI